MSPLAIAGGLALGLVIDIISGLIGIEGGAFLIPGLIFSAGCRRSCRREHSLQRCCYPSGSSRSGPTTRPDTSTWSAIAGGGWLRCWRVVRRRLAKHLSEVTLGRSFAVLLIALGIKLATGR